LIFAFNRKFGFASANLPAKVWIFHQRFSVIVDEVGMAPTLDATNILLFGEKVYNKEIERGVGLES
jgi:hypothetical protein